MSNYIVILPKNITSWLPQFIWNVLTFGILPLLSKIYYVSTRFSHYKTSPEWRRNVTEISMSIIFYRNGLSILRLSRERKYKLVKTHSYSFVQNKTRKWNFAIRYRYGKHNTKSKIYAIDLIIFSNKPFCFH